ncbi:MAG: caspase family protein [Cypionkella sp.]|uniref:caspase family protein n=1 Tax=Cypionkella sp. TaxID=2811411 RepID=UPI002ABC64C5|nr:caspase family protein [Cypionkella sp.]MDZ4309701.1 caspase family protein [Cypionkella sp.]
MFDRLSQFLRLCLFGILTLALLPAAAEAAGRKLALVVGNQAYAVLPGLNTPVEDAQGVSNALRNLGFEVTLLTDVGPAVFQAVLGTFAAQVDEADTVLFFYAGHAFQKNGINHLVPVNARLADAKALDTETWRLDDIAKALKGKTNQLLLFVDACRDNPLPEAVRGAAEAGGLAQFDGGAGTFVSFATAPGQVAWDKTEGSLNSPFTAALLTHIAQPGQNISDLMIKVRNDVGVATGGKQTPWEQSSLREQFYFVPPVAAAPVVDAPVVDEVLPEFEVVADQSTALAPPPGGIAVIGQGVADTQLAALDSDTRSLNAPLPENMALGVQTELDRIGCYGMRIDGDWGNGSRRAMAAYYEAKKLEPGEMEPTEAVYRALLSEPENTCEKAAVAVKAPTKTTPKATTKKSTTKKAAATTTKKKTAAPAPAPAKKKPTCKFMVIAVVCS